MQKCFENRKKQILKPSNFEFLAEGKKKERKAKRYRKMTGKLENI